MASITVRCSLHCIALRCGDDVIVVCVAGNIFGALLIVGGLYMSYKGYQKYKLYRDGQLEEASGLTTDDDLHLSNGHATKSADTTPAFSQLRTEEDPAPLTSDSSVDPVAIPPSLHERGNSGNYQQQDFKR